MRNPKATYSRDTWYTRMSDTAEFAPKQRELARRLLLDKSRSKSNIQYKKLVNRREFSRFSLSRLKLLFQNEWRSMQDEARRIETWNIKVKEEEKRQKNELQNKESEVQRIREEAERNARECTAEIQRLASRLMLVTKTIEELEIEKEKEMDRVMKLYEVECAKNAELSSSAITGVIFRKSVEIDHKIKELAKEIGNRETTEGWVMSYMARMIQREVVRLRRVGFKLFKSNIHPDDYLYDNDISTNIQSWWDERCKLSHDPKYCDKMSKESYVLLSAVVWDMVEQVCVCREEECRREEECCREGRRF